MFRNNKEEPERSYLSGSFLALFHRKHINIISIFRVQCFSPAEHQWKNILLKTDILIKNRFFSAYESPNIPIHTNNRPFLHIPFISKISAFAYHSIFFFRKNSIVMIQISNVIIQMIRNPCGVFANGIQFSLTFIP